MKFIQQAYKGNNEWWAYALTIFVLFFGWQFIGVIPLIGAALYYADDTSDFLTAANDNFTTLGIDANLYLFLIRDSSSAISCAVFNDFFLRLRFLEDSAKLLCLIVLQITSLNLCFLCKYLLIKYCMSATLPAIEFSTGIIVL